MQTTCPNSFNNPAIEGAEGVYSKARGGGRRERTDVRDLARSTRTKLETPSAPSIAGFTLAEVIIALTLGSMFILVIAQFLISQVETSYTLMANFKLIADMRGLSASLEKDMRQKDTFEVKYENGSWATAPVNEPGNRLIVTLIDGDTIQYDVTPVTLNGLTYNRVTRKRFYSSASKYLTEELSHDVTGQMTGTLENQLFMLGSNSELYISGVLNRSGKHGVTRQSTFQMVLY